MLSKVDNVQLIGCVINLMTAVF